jgi:hypothetical protein
MIRTVPSAILALLPLIFETVFSCMVLSPLSHLQNAFSDCIFLGYSAFQQPITISADQESENQANNHLKIGCRLRLSAPAMAHFSQKIKQAVGQDQGPDGASQAEVHSGKTKPDQCGINHIKQSHGDVHPIK